MRVLLVDDHTDGLEITARLLRLEGFDVSAAGCCADALRLARESQFDLVISDLGLPDGTGMQLLADLNRLYRIPGVAITAHGEKWYVDGASKGGFSRYLFKPFVFSDLLTAVREALSAPSAAPLDEPGAFPTV